MSVQKLFGEAGNLMKKMELDNSTWRVGSKMAWRGSLDRLDWSGGTDDEYDKKNLTKNTGLSHSDLHVSS